LVLRWSTCTPSLWVPASTPLAFLGGGVLFIVLAFALYRIDRILAQRAKAAAIVADLRGTTP
jgi:hypothetical protein